MIRPAVLCGLLGLAGCYSLNFDAAEYQGFIAIYELSELNRINGCQNTIDLAKQIDKQHFYSSHLARRKPVKEAIAKLKAISDGLASKAEFSVGYCAEKTELLSAATLKIIDSLGAMR